MSSYLSPVIQHNDQRIFVKGSVKEKEIDFLLDTGAEITVIPTKLAQGLNIPYKKTKLCLTGVIGEDSVLYETPPIEVQFGPKTLTTKLLCAPLNTGAILGMDLLRQINLTLDMSSESTGIKMSSAQISHHIWPIKKSNGTWRLTIDYRVANKHIDKITPLVADPSTIFNGLPLDCKIFFSN